jgi:hypothetical protein
MLLQVLAPFGICVLHGRQSVNLLYRCCIYIQLAHRACAADCGVCALLMGLQRSAVNSYQHVCHVHVHRVTQSLLVVDQRVCCLVLACAQEFIDIVETVYRGARKGRGLVVSPKDYSTKYRY